MGSEKLLFRLEEPHGLGNLYVVWQKGSGNYLATTGIDSVVNIFDRYGQVHESIKLQGLCTGFEWDSEGDVLGVVSQASQLILWDANTLKKQTLDVGLRDGLSFLVWAKSTPLLAIGTNKGNVTVYNHATTKRIPIFGKHSKKITCVAWNVENLLALGSDDRSMTISNCEGDTLRSISLRAEPSDIQFSEMKLDERLGTENTVSVIIGKKTLYLYNMLDPENPIELAFQQHYGSIVTYKWFGDGYILLGFSTGYFIAISTHIKEVGQELFQVKNHKSNLSGIALCNAIGKAASCGDNKRIHIFGKHSKKITCGAWNVENLLALGSDDRSMTISNCEGDTLRSISLRAEPSDIQFSEMKLDERLGTENTVSVIIGKKTLYLYNMLDPENPIELAFQQHYGSIVTYKWFGDGYILLGFSTGYFIAISTHIKEVGQELFQVKNHKSNLSGIALCNAIGKAASCGDNNIKIHDLANLQETSSVLTLVQETGVESIAWSTDGQLLAVCTRNGSLNVYVSNMPILSAVFGAKIAILSSLTEISLYNFISNKSKLIPITVILETEPTFIAVGPYHLAAGMNNRTWFYDLTKSQVGVEDTPLVLTEKQYIGVVTSIKLNVEYASVLYEGKIQLHMIEQPEAGHEDRESIIFPDVGSPNVLITCHALTTVADTYGGRGGRAPPPCGAASPHAICSFLSSVDSDVYNHV